MFLLHAREFSVALKILEIVKQATRGYHPAEIMTVRILVGEESAIVTNWLDDCWRELTHTTSLKSVKLEFEPLPLTYRCQFCGKSFHKMGDDGSCTFCFSDWIKVISGTELMVKEIDVLYSDTIH